MQEMILILDFGSQVTQLIGRRLRELNVYCEIHPYENEEQPHGVQQLSQHYIQCYHIKPSTQRCDEPFPGNPHFLQAW